MKRAAPHTLPTEPHKRACLSSRQCSGQTQNEKTGVETVEFNFWRCLNNLAASDHPDPMVQFFLGNVLYHGVGSIPEDKPEGFRWFLQASFHGHRQALFNCGSIYHRGLPGTVEVDRTKAAIFWGLAAQREHPRGLFNYAQCLHLGDGVSMNKEEAVKLFRKCADQHTMAEAQYKLGHVLRNGEGTDKNLPEALKYYHLAETQGHEIARLNLAAMYFFGEGTPVNKPKAAGFYKKVASTGHSTAQYNYAVMLITGDGVPQNVEEAIEYLKKSADNGYPSAQHALALRYATGDGVKEDKLEAFKLYQAASEKGHAKSLFQLGKMLETGDGVEKDILKAFGFYRTALEKGAPILNKIKSLVGPKMQTETYCC